MSRAHTSWFGRLWQRVLEGHLRRRSFIVNLLQQGISAEKIALSVAVGTIAGIFPVVGMTTILAFVASIWLRLNLVVVQIFNGITYPLQILCLIPLIRLGQTFFGEDSVPFSPEAFLALIQEERLLALVQLWSVTWKAVAAWGLVAPALTAALYFLLLPFMRRLRPAKAKAEPELRSSPRA